MKYINPSPHYKTFTIFGHKTSKIEIIDLTKAWVALSLAFAILLTRLYSTGGTAGFLKLWVLSAFTVGTAFLLHEMGHKITAQRYGYMAEFRSFDFMLLVAIAMSFLGFIIAAPGAVMIAGKIPRDKYGKVSMAGPLVNIILAALFGIALFVTGIPALRYGFLINGILALFNMLPFGNFDGKKILRWDKLVYGTMVGLSLLAVISAFSM